MKKLSKYCETCGLVADVPPRRRRCHRRKMNAKGFWTGFACWGTLRTVKTAKKPTKVAKKKAAMSDADRLRADSRKRLAQAEALLARNRKQHRAAGRRVTKWERKVRALKKLALRTDEQIEAARDRAAKASQVRIVTHRLLKSVGDEPPMDYARPAPHPNCRSVLVTTGGINRRRPTRYEGRIYASPSSSRP